MSRGFVRVKRPLVRRRKGTFVTRIMNRFLRGLTVANALVTVELGRKRRSVTATTLQRLLRVAHHVIAKG